MATVYVVTARSGGSSRIERVYLDGDLPAEPVQVEEWHTGAPPAADDGPYWRAK
jgi:hypothetical protein